MEKIITFEKLTNFTFTNHPDVKGPIRGIVLNFYGLGANAMRHETPKQSVFFAGNGVLYLEPYYNPWSWMNDEAVVFVDELLDVIFGHFALPDNTPVISTGFSMGGLSSLVYARYAKRTPKAVVSNCPVCDLVYHYTERDDLPRTLYSAFRHYDMTLNEALKTASPLHLVPEMPDIPYRIFHCGEDKAVNIDRHSRAFVRSMKEAGRNVTLRICEGRGHCDLTPEMMAEYWQTCLDEIDR